MRITAEIQPSQLATVYEDAVSDRHVAVGLFVPVKVPESETQKRLDEMRASMVRRLAAAFLVPSSRKTTLSEIQYQTVAGIRPYAALATALHQLYEAPIQTVIKDRISSATTERIKGFVETLGRKQTSHEMAAEVADFANYFATTELKDAYLDPSIVFSYWSIIDQLLHRTQGLPDDTSEIGYLFLDRTRIRPAGFRLGEHIQAISLAPGEELVLEQKSFVKETVSFEEALEREYERKMEFETERTRTRDTKEAEEVSRETSTHVGADAGVGGSVPMKGATINADVGVDAAQDFNEAKSVSNEQSVQIAGKRSEKTSSKLRSVHKTVLKISTEQGFEASSRRVLRNPNPTTALTLHCFKVMQRLCMQQERTGVRLCWAPFIPSPGASVAFRIAQAREKVKEEALAKVILPPPPSTPRPETEPVWKTGSKKTVSVSAMYVAIEGGTFQLIRGFTTLEVMIHPNENFTGRIRVRSSSQVPNAMIQLAPSHSEYGNRRGEDGYVRANVGVYLDLNLQSFSLNSVVHIWLEAEIMTQLPGYDESLQQYHNLLNQHHTEVAALQSAAIEEARPEFKRVERDILDGADIRSELLARVIQTIALAQRDEAFEVERWHRLIDFENIGYMLYPGWWSGSLPFPEYGAGHILNASWARVFLPARPSPEGTQASKTNEAKLLRQLYRPASDSDLSESSFNVLAKGITEDLLGEQKKFRNDKGLPASTQIGAEWVEMVPTDGIHIEAVLSATTAADLLVERQQTALVEQHEARAEAVRSGNTLVGRVQDPVSGQVIIGNGD